MGLVIGLVCRTVCLARLGKYVVSYPPQAIAHSCGRGVENVHLFYQPEDRGRVAFGERVV
jgi:hypothetical protein